jgi:hypothetical protein
VEGQNRDAAEGTTELLNADEGEAEDEGGTQFERGVGAGVGDQAEELAQKG